MGDNLDRRYSSDMMMVLKMTTLQFATKTGSTPPVQLAQSSGSVTGYPITGYMSKNVMVAFSIVIGNDSYYFANSTEFDRIMPGENTNTIVKNSVVSSNNEYVVSDFKTIDLAYNYTNDLSDVSLIHTTAVLIVDRNTRIPSGYARVRPWFPAGTMNYLTILLTYPTSADTW